MPSARQLTVWSALVIAAGVGAAAQAPTPRPAPQSLAAEGYATPLVIGELVYVFSRRADDEVVTALRANNGETVWQSTYLAPYKPDNAADRHGPGPKSTPLFHNGRLFTMGASGIVSAWDPRTGDRLWQLPAPAEHPLFNAASLPPKAT
jgi:outer membrane protein assembly factor BamB